MYQHKRNTKIGLKTGIGYYNKYLGIKNYPDEFSIWGDKEPGFLIYAVHELNLTKYFNLRSEIGYLNQKQFRLICF